MTVVIGIPTLNRFDLLSDCVASALVGTVRPDRVLIIDNSGGQCPPIPGAEIVLGRQPQSVAKAWNDAAHIAGGDWLLLSNDDITFAPDTIDKLLSVAAARPRAGIVSPIEGQRFSLFLLRWAAYLDMGEFDEGYTSAYFEDNHAARVLTLAQWELALAPSAVGHVGSATIQRYGTARMQRHHREFRANEARYLAIWGGPPHHERFLVPYGAL